RLGRRWVELDVVAGGPVVTALDLVFASDWYIETDEDLGGLVGAGTGAAGRPDGEGGVGSAVQVLPSGRGFPDVNSLRLLTGLVRRVGAGPGAAGRPDEEGGVGSAVQLLPSGPGFPDENNLRLFTDILYRAVDRVVICTPYFIPDDSLLYAVTGAVNRGVDVT